MKSLYTKILYISMCAFILYAAVGCGQNRHVRQGRYAVGDYDRFGVTFIVDKRLNVVGSALIYTAEGPHRRLHANKKIGKYELVPGVGAYGVKLGDTANVLQSLDDVKEHKPVTIYNDNPHDKLYGCTFSDGRLLQVTSRSGRVIYIVISGRFETPEGLRDRDGAAGLRRVYGLTDSAVWGNGN